MMVNNNLVGGETSTPLKNLANRHLGFSNKFPSEWWPSIHPFMAPVTTNQLAGCPMVFQIGVPWCSTLTMVVASTNILGGFQWKDPQRIQTLGSAVSRLHNIYLFQRRAATYWTCRS